MATSPDVPDQALYDRLYARSDLTPSRVPQRVVRTILIVWLLAAAINFLILDRATPDPRDRAIRAIAFGPAFAPLGIARAGTTLRIAGKRVPTRLVMVAVAGLVGGMCFLLINADGQRAAARAKHRRAARTHAERQARPNPSTIKRRFRLPGGGIPLGQLDGEVIGIPYGVNRGHYAIVAPTLSGKGLHATATLFRWPDAAVVVDPKSELYERTAGTRAATVGSIYRLPEQSIDLLDYYDFDDPLDVQFLHETLLRVWQDREPFWAEKSLPLFFAAGKCAKATADHPLRVLARWVQLAAPTAMAEARQYAPVEVGQFLDTDDPTAPINRTAQSAWATLVTRYTRLLPHIDTVTTATVPASWMTEGGTVYITYPLDQLSMAGSLVAAIVGAFVKAKMRAETSGTPRSFTLFALDEMPTTAIPRLDDYLSIMGGFGATALLYMQSLAQLDDVYGQDRARTILANCHQQVYYPPRDVPTAEYISKLFGTELQFVEATTRSRSIGHGPSYGRTQTSTSYQELVRPALDPAQLGGLPESTVVIFALADKQYRILAQRLDGRDTFALLPPPPPIPRLRRVTPMASPPADDDAATPSAVHGTNTHDLASTADAPEATSNNTAPATPDASAQPDGPHSTERVDTATDNAPEADNVPEAEPPHAAELTPPPDQEDDEDAVAELEF